MESVKTWHVKSVQNSILDLHVEVELHWTTGVSVKPTKLKSTLLSLAQLTSHFHQVKLLYFSTLSDDAVQK